MNTQDKQSGKRFEIFINDQRFEVFEEKLKGSEIKALAGIPPGNRLFLEVPGKDRPDQPIGDDEVVDLRSGLKFYDLPVGQVGLKYRLGGWSID